MFLFTSFVKYLLDFKRTDIILESTTICGLNALYLAAKKGNHQVVIEFSFLFEYCIVTI